MQYLYRAFDSEGTLLYVGISGRWSERLHRHEKTSQWMQKADIVKLERFETREAVMAAEKKAIKSERPMHNKQMNEDFDDARVHFKKLKEWLIGGYEPDSHRKFLNTIRCTFQTDQGFLNPKKSYDFAFAFNESYHWLAYHKIHDCRNCEAISRHGMYNSWTNTVEERLERSGYYDR
jgi:predicted GIY-YIG superfamily endonuclease